MLNWIEYADGVFEPVRKNGDLNRKHHGDSRKLDWWTVEKPLDWNPLEEGKQVTLDHDYRRPGTSSGGGPDAKPRAIDDKVHRRPKEGLSGSRRTMDLRVNGEDKSGVWPGRGPKSSLCKGAGACDELERVMYAGDDGSGTPDAEEDSDGVGESAPSATTPSAEPERPPETWSPHEAGSSEGEVKSAEPAIPALPAPGKSVAPRRSTMSQGSPPCPQKSNNSIIAKRNRNAYVTG